MKPAPQFQTRLNGHAFGAAAFWPIFAGGKKNRAMPCSAQQPGQVKGGGRRAAIAGHTGQKGQVHGL
ncbi:MAG: hypothetical protein AMXMBFR7_10970 [Planctomycetota bacterium]